MLAIAGSFSVLLCCCIVCVCCVVLCDNRDLQGCCVVSCVQVRQNNSVVRCNSVGVVIHKVVGLLWII